MTKPFITIAGCVGLTVIGAGYLHLWAAQVQKPAPARRSEVAKSQNQLVSSPAPTTAAARAVLDKYCITCHNDKAKTAGLQLDSLDLEHVGEHAETWEKVARKLRTGEMPPPGMPRPDPADLQLSVCRYTV